LCCTLVEDVSRRHIALIIRFRQPKPVITNTFRSIRFYTYMRSSKAPNYESSITLTCIAISRTTNRLINLFPPGVKYFGSLCTSATVGVNLGVGYNPRKLQDHQGCQQNGHESTSFSLLERCGTFHLGLGSIWIVVAFRATV